MAKKRGYYEGMSASKMQEKRDGEMIGTGFGFFANMPTSPIVKMYPKTAYSAGETLNDGRKGIDVQISSDMKGKKKEQFPEKY